MDWLAIADWAYTGIFAVVVRFQNQNQFWISHQELHGACDLEFLKNLKISLFGHFGDFGDFGFRIDLCRIILSFSDYAYYVHKTSSCPRVEQIFQKNLIVLVFLCT